MKSGCEKENGNNLDLFKIPFQHLADVISK
jgi:hypothetical protein